MVKSKKRISLAIIYVFLLAIAFGITSYSSTLVHTTFCSAYDSYAYRYMGMLMAKGGIPYIDAFDNKGPVLYLIEYFGYVINREYGIYLLEMAFVYAFLILQFKICSKFLDSFRALICTLLSVSILSFTFVGNMCEEYSLFFISVGMYVFIEYFVFHRTSRFLLIVSGFSFGCVLLIRPNMVVMWGVLCVAVIINEIISNYKIPIGYMISFVLGLLIILIPILIWLITNGALVECYKDYILSNFNYINHDNSVVKTIDVFWNYFFSLGTPWYIFILLALMALETREKANILFNISYIICVLLTVCSLSLKGVLFLNYAMIISPLLPYPIAALVKFLHDKNIKKIDAVSMILCFLCSITLWIFMINNIICFAKAYLNGNPYQSDDQKVLELIESNSSPDDRILVLGYKCFYYVESDRLCSSIFYYQLNDNETYPDGPDAVLDDINDSLPRLIIVEGGVDWEKLFRYYDRYQRIEGYPGIWRLIE